MDSFINRMLNYINDYSSIVGACPRSLVGPSGRCGWSSVHRFLVGDPILLGVIEWVDHLGYEFVLLGDLQYRSGVFVSAAVVSGREHREQLSASESLEPVHDALVRSEDELGFIVIKELLHSVRAELDDVARAVGVADEVRLDAQFLVIVCRVRPQNVHHQLLLRSADFVDHFQRSLDGVDLLQRHQSAANAAVQTDDLVFNQRCERQPVEEVVDLREDRVWLRGVLAQAVAALLRKAEGVVDPLVLVVPAQQVDFVRILHFQRHQQTYRLQ